MTMSENCNSAAYDSKKKRFTVYESSIKGGREQVKRNLGNKLGQKFIPNHPDQ